MSRIIWARPALGDIQDVVDWLRLDSPSAAFRFANRVDEAVTRLIIPTSSWPHSSRVGTAQHRPLPRARNRAVASVLPDDQGQVYVLAVIDGRRNVEDIHLRRLLRE